MPPRKLQPALFGGAFIGAFSALPVVALGNVCCCLWLVVGGALSAWLMQQDHQDPVAPLDGAAVGALAGVIGAFVYLLIAWPITLVLGPMMEEWLQRLAEGARDVPLRDLIDRYRGGGARALGLAITFFLQLTVGVAFSTVGGVLGAMLFPKASTRTSSQQEGTPGHQS